MKSVITEDNRAEHYRLDVALFRKQLRKYGKGSPVYRTLLEHFVAILLEKYDIFINDFVEGMPDSDLDIREGLESAAGA